MPSTGANSLMNWWCITWRSAYVVQFQNIFSYYSSSYWFEATDWTNNCAQVMTDDVTRVVSAKIPKVDELHVDFCQFQFFPRVIPYGNTPLVSICLSFPQSFVNTCGWYDVFQAVLAMFDDLGMISRWRINREQLSRFVSFRQTLKALKEFKFYKLRLYFRFILMVRRGYRDPPYHNWSHAFSVAHFGYLLLKNLNLMQNHLSYAPCPNIFMIVFNRIKPLPISKRPWIYNESS